MVSVRIMFSNSIIMWHNVHCVTQKNYYYHYYYYYYYYYNTVSPKNCGPELWR